MEVKRTMIASQLIIEAGEQYHKRPTQLKFEELVDVVQAVVKNCFIPPVIKSVCDCAIPIEKTFSDKCHICGLTLKRYSQTVL